MEIEKKIPRASIHDFVEFIIYEHPGKSIFEKCDIEPGERCAIDEINDELIIRDDSQDLKGCKKMEYA